MITKKLLLCGVLGAVALFSTTSFASHHSHHHQRIKFNHHHPSSWGHAKFHRMTPHRSHIVVRAAQPHVQIHRHY